MKLVMMTKLARLALMIFLAASLRAAEAPAGTAIDPQKSSITVRVFKAGVFSAFGHEHEISAPIQQGSFTENPASVEITVDARRMRVMDKGISEKTGPTSSKLCSVPRCWTARNSRQSVFARL